MSYEDGDVSMASFRDESFNMSVDQDTIDVVWHSTQQPVIQSILEESKLHQRQKSPHTWDPNQAASSAGCSTTAPKSLFKDTSTTRTPGSHTTADHWQVQVRTRPGMGRVTSSPDLPASHLVASFPASSGASVGAIPTDPRKIRPSQRRSLIQADVLSGRLQHERASQVPASSTENLDNLREMIKSVGRTWGSGSSPVFSIDSKGTPPVDRPPSRTKQAREAVASHSTSHLTASSSRGGPEVLGGIKHTKPKLATTIKVLKVPSDAHKAVSSRAGESKGLMLPPALPAHRMHSIDASSIQFPSKSPTEVDDTLQQADTGMQLDGDDDLFSTRNVPYPTHLRESLPPSPKILASQLPQDVNARIKTPLRVQCIPSPPETPSTRQPPERSMTATHNPPLSQQSQPKKVLGMRRTLSGNRFESNTAPSSQQPALSQPIKRSSTTSSLQSTSHASPLLESPEPPTMVPAHIPTIPLPPPGMRISPELASRPKSFKVPWANSNASPVEQGSSSPQAPLSNSQSSGGTTSPATTSISSSSPPHGGANVAKAMVTVANGSDTVMWDYGTSENADSSYSFDDIDADELDRVLSQCGA